MNVLHDTAYLLDRHVLGESDLILTFLAERHGRVRAVARAARRSRKRFGGLLDPMTCVKLHWVELQGRELHRVESLEGLRSYSEMQSDPLRQAACAVLAELTLAFAHEGQEDPDGFRLLGAVLDALEQGGAVWPLIRYFEYWTLRIHGLLPEIDSCSSCGRGLDPGSPTRVVARGGVHCSGCAAAGPSAARLGRAERRFLDDVRRLPPTGIRGHDDVGCRRGLELLLRGTLESFAERSFRTYRHLVAADVIAAGGSA